jgi:hypothetical protein
MASRLGVAVGSRAGAGGHDIDVVCGHRGSGHAPRSLSVEVRSLAAARDDTDARDDGRGGLRITPTISVTAQTAWTDDIHTK